MHPLLKHVHRLSVIIGPRGSGTAQEAAAGQWIHRQFKQLGYNSAVNSFRTVGTFSIIQAIFFGSMLAALALSFIWPWPAALLQILLLTGYILDVETRFSIAPLLARRQSQNIRAWHEQQDKTSKDTVVIMAHYDSSRAALNFHPKMVKGFRRSFLLLFAALAGITFFTFLRAIPGFSSYHTAFTWVSLLLGGYILVVLLLLAHRELFCRYTPGANDNASGIAVMLGIATRLKRAPIPGVRVEFLATGAEEAGTFGILEYIKTYSLTNKVFINLDNLGRGQLFVTTAEGIIGTYPACPKLLALVEEAAAADPPLAVNRKPYRLLTTDATGIMARGGRAISVMACDAQGNLPNWHWTTDTIENVDAANLKTAEELVCRILQRMGGALHEQEAAG